jgi:small subunit ribosomal protein S21
MRLCSARVLQPLAATERAGGSTCQANSLPERYDRKGGESRLAEIHVQDGETLESALRRFKRKVLQEDIIKEIKRHAFYLKPGQKKRIKAELARKRNRKKRSRDSDAEQARS